MSIKLTDATNIDLLTAAIGAGGPLHTCHMGLFTNNIVPTNTSQLEDFVQPHSPGIMLEPITWGPVYQQPDNSFAVNSQIVTFQMADDTVPIDAVYGYFISNSAASNIEVAYAERFGQVQTLPDSLAALQISTQFVIGGSDDGDGTVIV